MAYHYSQGDAVGITYVRTFSDLQLDYCLRELLLVEKVGA